MKLLLMLSLLPLTVLSCEQSSLENLREAHTMEELKRFIAEGEITMGMFNHVIAHNDLELLKMFFSEQSGNVIEIKYEDFRLSQADRRGARPIYFNPLHLAAQFGAEDVAAFCLENGACPNKVTQSEIPEYHNNTPAHIAAMYGKEGIIMLLATTGADNPSTRGAFLDIRNGLNQTPEDIARAKGNPLIIDIFKKLRAIKEKNAKEQNPA